MEFAISPEQLHALALALSLIGLVCVLTPIAARAVDGTTRRRQAIVCVVLAVAAIVYSKESSIVSWSALAIVPVFTWLYYRNHHRRMILLRKQQNEKANRRQQQVASFLAELHAETADPKQ